MSVHTHDRDERSTSSSSAAVTTTTTDDDAVQRVRVGPVSSFVDGDGSGGSTARQLVKCGTRNIVVLWHAGVFYAIDNACYHHGGPLLHGDIEDMGDHVCIVCPWHRYCIALDTGEGLYLGLSPTTTRHTQSHSNDNNNNTDSSGRRAPAPVAAGALKPVVCSKGRKQRVHRVIVEDGVVYVCVDLRGPALESDVYANMPLANHEAAMTRPLHSSSNTAADSRLHSRMSVLAASSLPSPVTRVHARMPPPSGHVFQGLARASHASSSSSSSSTGKHTTRRMASRDVSIAVVCRAAIDVCCGVRALTFAQRRDGDGDGELTRLLQSVPAHALLGESMDLVVLPVQAQAQQQQHDDDDDARSVRRTYTICDVHTPASPRRVAHSDNNNNNNNDDDDDDDEAYVTILVKASTPDDATTRACATSVSAWLHAHALTSTSLRIVRVGGARCVLAAHVDKLRRCAGRVLWLTAGVGITSAYAAGKASQQPRGVFACDDDHASSSSRRGDAGGVLLHVVHVHTDRTVAHVAMLPAFLQWHADDTRGRSSSYCFRLILTRQDGPATTTTATTADSAPLLRRVAVTYGRRIVDKDVAEAVRESFGAASFVALLCGPAAFVRTCATALRRLGVAATDILSDEPT